MQKIRWFGEICTFQKLGLQQVNYTENHNQMQGTGRSFALQVYYQIPGGNYSFHSTLSISAHALAASRGVFIDSSSRPVGWVPPLPAVLTRDTDTPNVIDNSSTMATQSHLMNSPASSLTGEPVEPQPHHRTPSFSPELATRCDKPQRTEMGHPSSSHKKGKVIGRNREKRQLDKARPAAVGTHDPKWELNGTKKCLLTALYIRLNGIYALSPA